MLEQHGRGQHSGGAGHVNSALSAPTAPSPGSYPSGASFAEQVSFNYIIECRTRGYRPPSPSEDATYRALRPHERAKLWAAIDAHPDPRVRLNDEDEDEHAADNPELVAWLEAAQWRRKNEERRAKRPPFLVRRQLRADVARRHRPAIVADLQAITREQEKGVAALEELETVRVIVQEGSAALRKMDEAAVGRDLQRWRELTDQYWAAVEPIAKTARARQQPMAGEIQELEARLQAEYLGPAAAEVSETAANTDGTGDDTTPTTLDKRSKISADGANGAHGGGDDAPQANTAGKNNDRTKREGTMSGKAGATHDDDADKTSGRADTSSADGDGDPFEDELARIVDRVADNPGCVFEAGTIKLLADLKKRDRAAAETLRVQLKRAGVRVAQLDRAVDDELGEVGGRSATQADILIELAGEAELFHKPDETGYADVVINGHRETWPIRAKGFRRWLARRYFEKTGGAPNSEALQAALNVIESKAHFDSPERTVHVRVAAVGDKLYLDLADDRWRAVEIGPNGWRVVAAPPVRFRRSGGMLPLPEPKKGGSIQKLRAFLNVRSDRDFVLVVAWVLAALRGRGPYPVLVLAGEQGSAKSTFMKVLRMLVDPNSVPLRTPPREDRDLFIAATNSHVLAYDNVSTLPPWISDALCQIATGGGFATRQLYTDQDEVLLDAVKPIAVNGIEDVVTRPDLADRSIFITLQAIPDEERRLEEELEGEFGKERPAILGALLTAVAHGLRMWPTTRLRGVPRMADFAKWATACETALWPPGTFLAAYSDNRAEAVDTVIEADPVAMALRAHMKARTVWTGTASDLLGALLQTAGEAASKSKSWPDSPRALSGRLRRAATFLRKVGIAIEFIREGSGRTRTIRISSEAETTGNLASRPSAGKSSSGQPADGTDAKFPTDSADDMHEGEASWTD